MSTTTITRRGRIRRLVTTAVASAAIMTGAVVGVAAPAQAATGTGVVGACFNATTTSGYTGPMTLTPVSLDYWTGATWVSTGMFNTNNKGCVNITVNAGYSYQLRMNYYTKPFRVVGTSNWATVYAGQSWNLGTVKAGMIYVG